MSALEFPDVQIWNNATFCNREFEDPASVKLSWSNMQPISVNRTESFESDSAKENVAPVCENSPLPTETLKSMKPLCSNIAINTNKPVGRKSFVESLRKSWITEEIRDEKQIDSEIEEIEMEIGRLSLRLEALRLEKAERNAKMLEKRGKIVAAKFLDQNQSGGKSFGSIKKKEKNLGPAKNLEDSFCFNGESKPQRRGVSLGPIEIIFEVRSKQLNKPEITPAQSRRKSCFWKLQDIDEGKQTKKEREKEKCFSLSPKSRRIAPKIQAPKKGMTTVGSKKVVRKEDAFISSIQPKKLFKEGEKSVEPKKPFRAGRVVPSRYNHVANGNSSARKRSLPGNEEGNGKKVVQKRASMAGKSHGNASNGTESRVKKKWEIPRELVIYNSSVEDIICKASPHSFSELPDELPKIRTVRCESGTPRDSGPAKKVAELIGRRSFFGSAVEEEQPSVRQVLGFAENERE